MGSRIHEQEAWRGRAGSPALEKGFHTEFLRENRGAGSAERSTASSRFLSPFPGGKQRKDQKAKAPPSPVEFHRAAHVEHSRTPLSTQDREGFLIPFSLLPYNSPTTTTAPGTLRFPELGLKLLVLEEPSLCCPKVSVFLHFLAIVVGRGWVVIKTCQEFLSLL